MIIEQVIENGVTVALISADNIVITDTQSALDLAASVKYETNGERIVIDKNNITEDFFKLSSGVAGEILQKYINYRVKIAIYGDYSHYTSKPLHDFIYEANKGSDVFFVSTKDEAVRKLAQAR